MKPLFRALLLCLACWACVTAENEMFVAKNRCLVFLNDKRALYEKPIFMLKEGDKVTVLADSSENAHIMASDGRTGYVERQMLTDNVKSVLSMDEIRVFGWLDNPEPVYILDFENGEYKPIRMSRDFAMDPVLMRNIDKETFERENEIYYYKGYSSEAVNR
ncbi:MAG: hypothetical protein V1913_06775 [Fibrobacterota bacterium]